METNVMDLLNKPFDTVKERPGNFGVNKYVETSDVIRRLTAATHGNWNFEILEHFQIADELIVHGRLHIGETSRDQYGSKTITLKKGTTDVIQPGADLKAAASDCLKKCATYFGVGLSMYEETDEEKQESRREECAFNLNLITEGEKELAQISDCTIEIVKKHLCAVDLDTASNDALGGYVAVLKARIVNKKKEIEKKKNEDATVT